MEKKQTQRVPKLPALRTGSPGNGMEDRRLSGPVPQDLTDDRQGIRE